jgi:spore maturation protein CgeB|tara:strand:+ start:30781 stop:31731 length:951 start_codon:yes stop_codon:yes gene_type:complete
MKILYLERDHGNSYSYYNEILSSLASQEGVEGIIKYSDWYPQDEHPLDIRYVLDRCEEEPDVIVVGFGWTDCSNAHPKPLVGTKEASVPVSIILNKEYAALDKKLSWIRDVDPIAAFTVHHDYKLYEKQTSVPFYQIPFAVNEKVFKNYGQNYSHDFGFSGVIRPEQANNWRAKILENSKNWDDIKLFFSEHRHDSLESYARRINSTKIWLSTTGPADLVGTRYYEVMACNTTLLACNRAKKVYGGLFEEDKHCIMFDTLQELQDKIHYYINHEDERESMIQRAYDHVLQNHTWNNRGEEMINTLTKKLEKQNGKA